MTIEQADKVDGIGIDYTKGEVVLIISDHLEWDDNNLHFANLEQKLNGYIGFIKSGQAAEVVPKSTGMPAGIKLVCKYEPTIKTISVLEGSQ